MSAPSGRRHGGLIVQDDPEKGIYPMPLYAADTDPSMSGDCAISPWKTESTSGALRTISAKARRLPLCRLPKNLSVSGGAKTYVYLSWQRRCNRYPVSKNGRLTSPFTRLIIADAESHDAESPPYRSAVSNRHPSPPTQSPFRAGQRCPVVVIVNTMSQRH